MFSADPGLRWLFCMTHPDDEISICAWIARVAKQDPDLVWMSWTHHTPVREAEARDVARQLGVREDHLFFHGGTDGAVCDEMPKLLPQFKAMMEEVNPDSVVCGAFEQGHLDHDSTNFMVNHSASCPVIEIPFYHTYLTRMPRVNRFADPVGEEVLSLTGPERALKKEIAKSYPSQAIWKNMVFAELWARLTGDGSLRATERARFQTHRQFDQPNVPDKLLRKVLSSTKWSRWLQALENLGETR